MKERGNMQRQFDSIQQCGAPSGKKQGGIV